MNLRVINTGLFKLDGGAMFGVVPKSMWQKLNPPDQNNMCTWAMRCLLIEDNNRSILIDTGMGTKQDDKFRSHFYPHGEDTLALSLNRAGLENKEITDVILTHLHFDHVGGAVERRADGMLETTFQNARYWSNENHWNWALTPNEREKNSFLKENFETIKSSGQLHYLMDNGLIVPEITMKYMFGHTEAMMVPFIDYKNTKIVFAADLMPSSYHIPIPYVMCYDVRPLETLKEKERILGEIADNGYILFFEHDPIHECGTLKRNENGKIVLDKVGRLSDFL
jgi:glyoxylase-like metal-dependent hydrolase (beta-lactamase superfamily II)